MRVLVCGGRDYGVFNDAIKDNKPLVVKKQKEIQVLKNTLNSLDKHNLTIISGMALGADWLAATWAIEHKVPLLKFPANWAKYGKSAGHIRNIQMLEEGEPDFIIAFPGGVGTKHMLKKAINCGVKQIDIIL